MDKGVRVPLLSREICYMEDGRNMPWTKPFKVPERPISLYCVRGSDYKERLIKQARTCFEPMKHEVCERCTINQKKRKMIDKVLQQLTYRSH